MAAFLKELVVLESPSTDKKAVDRCSSLVVSELKKAGARVTRLNQDRIGDFTIAEFPSAEAQEESGQTLILTHIDTVWPVGTIQKTPFYVSGNKVFGPGALDMKGGIAMVVFSLKTFHELNILPKKPVVVFINSTEEIGSESSYAIIRDLALKSSHVICLEPALPGGALKIQRKGRLVVRLNVQGKAAHAATPDRGVNAIEELLHQLHILKKLKTKEVTVNIGLISGGEKANVVPEEASATVDFRFWNTSQKDKITSCLKQLQPLSPPAKVSHMIESMTPPMEKTPASTSFLNQVRKIAAEMNISLQAGKTGGGSDASIASALGVPTLDGLGPDGEGIHAKNEHIILSSLIERTALLTQILIKV